MILMDINIRSYWKTHKRVFKNCKIYYKGLSYILECKNIDPSIINNKKVNIVEFGKPTSIGDISDKLFFHPTPTDSDIMKISSTQLLRLIPYII